MPERKFNVLFLCTGNSARSQIAESLMNRHGAGKFAAYSAGSHPGGEVHALALWILVQKNYQTEGLRSKDWNEFSGPGAPRMDFVFTVCDNAAGEACPVWSGQPVTANWGMPDPAAVEGLDTAKRAAFRDAFAELEHRISSFANLPIDSLEQLELKQRLDEIGQSRPAD